MSIVSFDISTKHLAYAVFTNGELKEYGKLDLMNNADDRIGSVAEVVYNKFKSYDIPVVIYENGYLANSPKTLMELSKISGSLIGGMRLAGVAKFIAIPPITWQVGIGVGPTSPLEMDKLNKKYPGRKISWIKSKNRENRKQLIIDFVNKEFGLELTMKENDQADAIALGYYVLYRKAIK
jgi:Holliday junction resolvasome RuvABC endonuclease subunit